MKLNYRNKWTWFGIYLVLLVFCYFFIGTISAGMGLFGFAVGYTLSRLAA